MRYRVLTAAGAVAALLALTACSSYSGITAVQRASEARDDLPVEVRSVNPDMPSDYRLLTEDAGVKYFAAESPDHKTACIAVYPVDEPDQWTIGCADGIEDVREIVTVSHIGQPTAKLVTTGFDTRTLESEGWRKIHENVLVGTITRP
ncbi:hypothetical protein [Arthrobacter sp. HMWF013]|uniref:hypothetical protein n=1 Tax=Arthrobacter sp. HMWF013 TaxID=2056849 RepID=UPI000D3637D1|nr:hypothetical protein [Arthrobacter sp. HMWF013]PTT69986.1 hypothetical protein DBR22_02305 [Arthrobacter sp. HMWF013]